MKADKDRVEEIEQVLTSKGIAKDDYKGIHNLLQELKNTEDHILEEKGAKYFEDAFKATAGFGLSRDMIVQVARFLAQFADRIAQETLENERQQNDAPTPTSDDKSDKANK